MAGIAGVAENDDVVAVGARADEVAVPGSETEDAGAAIVAEVLSGIAVTTRLDCFARCLPELAVAAPLRSQGFGGDAMTEKVDRGMSGEYSDPLSGFGVRMFAWPSCAPLAGSRYRET